MKKRYLILCLIFGLLAFRIYYPVVEDYFEDKSCTIGSVNEEQYAKILEEAQTYVSKMLKVSAFHPRHPKQSSNLLQRSIINFVPENVATDIKLSYIHALMTSFGGRLVFASEDKRNWGDHEVAHRDPRDFRYLFASGKFSLIDFGADIIHLLVFAPIDFTLFYQSVLRFNENPDAYESTSNKKFLKVGKYFLVEPDFGSPAGGPKESTPRMRKSIGCPTIEMLGQVGENL